MCPERAEPNAGFVPMRGTRGARGLPLCRWCGKEVEPPRRSFCRDECQHEHWLRASPAYARSCVAERDRGVCGLCGIDTSPLAEIFPWAKRHYDDLFSSLESLKAWGGPWYQRRVYAHFFHEDLAQLIGVTRMGRVWEMDHIVPVIEGGGACGMDNLRTLCIPCHRAVTRDLKRRLASARRTEEGDVSSIQETLV